MRSVQSQLTREDRDAGEGVTTTQTMQTASADCASTGSWPATPPDQAGCSNHHSNQRVVGRVGTRKNVRRECNIPTRVNQRPITHPHTHTKNARRRREVRDESPPSTNAVINMEHAQGQQGRTAPSSAATCPAAGWALLFGRGTREWAASAGSACFAPTARSPQRACAASTQRNNVTVNVVVSVRRSLTTGQRQRHFCTTGNTPAIKKRAKSVGRHQPRVNPTLRR